MDPIVPACLGVVTAMLSGFVVVKRRPRVHPGPEQVACVTT